MSELSTLTQFLDRLDDSGIHYALTSVTEGAITVSVVAGVERWEIEFSDEGEIEVLVFKTDGKIYDFSTTEELFQSGRN